MKLKGETLFSMILFLVFLAAFVFSLEWPDKARMYPLILSSGGIIFSGWLVYAGFKGKQIEKGKSESLKNKIKKKKEVNVRMEIIMMGWLVGFIATILVIGLWVAIAAFIPLFMRVYGHEKWKFIGLFTAVAWFSIFLVFSQVMGVSLFGGVLGLAW